MATGAPASCCSPSIRDATRWSTSNLRLTSRPATVRASALAHSSRWTTFRPQCSTRCWPARGSRMLATRDLNTPVCSASTPRWTISDSCSRALSSRVRLPPPSPCTIRVAGLRCQAARAREPPLATLFELAYARYYERDARFEAVAALHDVTTRMRAEHAQSAGGTRARGRAAARSAACGHERGRTPAP